MVGVLVFLCVGVLVLGLVAWAGHRMLNSDQRGSSGMTDALGSFIDVFDPARAKADRDLQSQKHQGTVIPSPDGDPPMTIDLDAGRATINKPLSD